MASPPGQASQQEQRPWDYNLRKYLLLLATLVATVTYSAGFNPPGGVWQDTGDGHLAGDPIIRDIRYIRYAFFFYCNASAFASSLLVAVLILLLAMLDETKDLSIKLLPLRVVMVLDIVSLMMAYTAGTCRDRFTKLYSSLLLAASVVAYLILQVVLAFLPDSQHNTTDEQLKAQAKRRKVLMLLATFAVSLTYLAGLSTPGGFWDNAEDGHRPGDAILKEQHEARLTAFFVCNTTAFVASLFIIALLLDKKLHKTGVAVYVLNGCIVVALIGLVGAYAAGSSRETGTTTYVVSLGVAVLLCILLVVIVVERWPNRAEEPRGRRGGDVPSDHLGGQVASIQGGAAPAVVCSPPAPNFMTNLTLPCFEHKPNAREELRNDAVDKARSLVLLLATLGATITYQAGLDPPGGVWQENGDGHLAGDPVLLTINPKRYKVFFYCNSVSFVASLVVIVLVQRKLLLRHHVLEAAMVLDLFGLIGAYAAGTCRDMSTSIYVMAMAGVVLVYVVIHVIFFTLDHREERDEQVETRRKRLLLFAILAATITYQAGLTPPSGFLLKDDETTGHRTGDPILLYNSARRYTAFFYCNSASFMLSMALIILLVNPNMYRPAIRSYALSVCTAAGLFGLVGAYAAGSTQQRSTSISIIVMASVLLLVLVLLLLVFLVQELKKRSNTRPSPPEAEAEDEPTEQERQDKKKHAKRKYLMLLGILVASVTYQAGLDQPGGVWQHTSDGHHAGNPVMQDNRGRRYHAFFYCNSTAFVASIVVIILLLPRFRELQEKDWWFRVMSTTVLLDLLALLGAYAIGSSRDRKTSALVAALIAAVLAYFVVHVMLSILCSLASSCNQPPTAAAEAAEPQSQQQGIATEVP